MELRLNRGLSKKPALSFFEMPNNLRSTPEDYGLQPEGQARSTELPFDDPYPDLDWGLDSHAFGGNYPTSFVLDEDGELQEVEFIDDFEDQGFDATGYYQPGWEYPDWGIFIYTEQIDSMARLFFGNSNLNPFQAWMVAFRSVLYHEYFHFLSEYHCRRLTPTDPSTSRYERYSREMHEAMNDDSRRLQVKEEAVANAYSYQRIMKHSLGRWESYIHSMFKDSPVPYCEYTNYTTNSKRQLWGLATVASQHHTFWPTPKLSSFNPDSASIFFPKPKMSVPVYLVTNGKIAHMASENKWNIFPTIGGSFPEIEQYLDDVNMLIEGLNGDLRNETEKLLSTKDEMHVYYHEKSKFGGNVALFAQLPGVSGWWMVYFGPKDQCQWVHID